MNHIIDSSERRGASLSSNDLGDATFEVYKMMEELMKVHNITILKPEEIFPFLELTHDVLDKKFRLLNSISDEYERLLQTRFGINNTNLLNVFRLIEWLTNKKDNLHETEIEKCFFEFLNYGNFDLMNLNIEKIKLVLIFLKNFNRADVTGILQFLRDLQLTREYVYIFSRYIWIATLNRNFTVEDSSIDEKLRCSISVLNWYPFFELIIYEIETHQQVSPTYIQEIKTFRTRYMTSISKIPYDKIFTIVDRNLDKYNQDKLLSMLRGESFKNFIGYISENLSNFSDVKFPDLRAIIFKLIHLFFFSIQFFNDEDKIIQPDRRHGQVHLDAIIDFNISTYIELMEVQRSNQLFMAGLFESDRQFSRVEIDKRFEPIFTKKLINPISFETTAYNNNVGMKHWDDLFNAGKYIWFIKYYVLQVKASSSKLEEIRNQYQKVFLHEFYRFLIHALGSKAAQMLKSQEKKKTLKSEEPRKLTKEQSRSPDEDLKFSRVREIALQKEKAKTLQMVTKMINLFLDMKFKKNYNSVFYDLVDFLSRYVFRPGEKDERLLDFVKKINVESFFEVYDNTHENRNIFNRSAENILRLALNTLKNFDFNIKSSTDHSKEKTKSFSKVATCLVSVCRGNISQLEDLLKEILQRNDRVAYAMNQIRWCDEFIKSNTQRKRISEHRKVSSRMKNSSSVRFLNEMNMTDQTVFINNLKNKASLISEVMPYFEANLLNESSYYSKYDVFKLLKRMGFEMSIHRLNEIVSDSIDTRRVTLLGTVSTSSNYLTREEVKKCLLAIEARITAKVIQMRRADFKHLLFLGAICTGIAYVLARINMALIRRFWISGDEYASFISCAPILGTR